MHRSWFVVMFAYVTVVGASAASAQTLGSFRWQLRPFCNVLTMSVVQQGTEFLLDGTDDQCGAAQAASADGLAFQNPNGTIGFGLTVVTAPGGRPVHVDATIALPGLNGTWRDSSGATGTLVLTPGAAVAGEPRPEPSADPPSWSRIIPDDRRFTLVLEGTAARDNETGLTWQLNPAASSVTFNGAHTTCHNLRLARRSGWRIPTMPELASLAQQQPVGVSPALPTGHPFTIGTLPSFWSQSNYGVTTNFLVGHLGGSTISYTQQPPADSYRVWCVRGPTGATR